MEDSKLNIAHIYVLSKLYDAYVSDKKPIVIQLEDGNKEHADIVNQLIDMGYIHVMPDKNLLLTHLTNEGLALMKVTEKLKGIIR